MFHVEPEHSPAIAATSAPRGRLGVIVAHVATKLAQDRRGPRPSTRPTRLRRKRWVASPCTTNVPRRTEALLRHRACRWRPQGFEAIGIHVATTDHPDGVDWAFRTAESTCSSAATHVARTARCWCGSRGPSAIGAAAEPAGASEAIGAHGGHDRLGSAGLEPALEPRTTCLQARGHLAGNQMFHVEPRVVRPSAPSAADRSIRGDRGDVHPNPFRVRDTQVQAADASWLVTDAVISPGTDRVHLGTREFVGHGADGRRRRRAPEATTPTSPRSSFAPTVTHARPHRRGDLLAATSRCRARSDVPRGPGPAVGATVWRPRDSRHRRRRDTLQDGATQARHDRGSTSHVASHADVHLEPGPSPAAGATVWHPRRFDDHRAGEHPSGRATHRPTLAHGHVACDRCSTWNLGPRPPLAPHVHGSDRRPRGHDLARHRRR